MSFHVSLGGQCFGFSCQFSDPGSLVCLEDAAWNNPALRGREERRGKQFELLRSECGPLSGKAVDSDMGAPRDYTIRPDSKLKLFTSMQEPCFNDSAMRASSQHNNSVTRVGAQQGTAFCATIL